jgi:hypothetical protein
VRSSDTNSLLVNKLRSKSYTRAHSALALPAAWSMLD